MPATITSKAPGQRPPGRANTASASRDSAPKARLGKCQCATCAATPCSTDCASCPTTLMPSKRGNCLTMIISAKPNANPRKTGFEMKADTAPTFALAPSRNSKPANMTRPAANCIRKAVSLPASELVAASNTAAEDEVADTMANRLVPSKA
jgi:hypothetical protein